MRRGAAVPVRATGITRDAFVARALAALLLWAVTLALPDAARGADGDRIGGVAFQGLVRIEPAALEQVLPIRIGDPVTRTTARRCIEALWASGKIDHVSVFSQRTADDEITLVFRVRERPAIREIEYKGYDDVTIDDIKAVVDVKINELLDPAKLTRNAEKIRQVYLGKGFNLAEVRWRLKRIPRANEVVLVFDITEGYKVKVRRVDVVGNRRIAESEIRGAMMTKEGDLLSFINQSGTFREEMLQRDRFAIQQLYNDRGFVDAKVAEPTALLSPDRRDVSVTFRIEEGESYTLGTLVFSGDLLVDDKGVLLLKPADMRAVFRTKPGEPFHRTHFVEDLQKLTDIYMDRGYAFANITPNIQKDDANRVLHIFLDIEKGDEVYVERIDVAGNTKTRDKVVRREMQIAEGDLYSTTLVKASEVRVKQLGFFAEVNITTERGSRSDRVVLRVTVKERSTGSFQLGFGFSSVEQFIFQAQIAQENLLGRGQSLSFQALISAQRRQFSLRFVEPYLLDTRTTAVLNLFNQELIFPAQGPFGGFRRGSTGGELRMGYPVYRNDLFVFAGYSFQDLRISAPSLLHAHLFKSGRTSSLIAQIRYDTRDNRLFPTRGVVQNLQTEIAPDWLGSEIEVWKLNYQAQFFYPLFWKVIFRMNIDTAWVFSLEQPNADRVGRKDFPGVPIAERFLLGGIFSIRGYAFGSISPAIRVINPDDPLRFPSRYRHGGTKRIVVNIETEFPILEAAQVRGVFFYDMGNTFAEDEQWFYIGQRNRNVYNLPLGLYMSAGFGFRWYSPVGPLRFEFGFPITRRPEDDRMKFEFSIGQPF